MAESAAHSSIVSSSRYSEYITSAPYTAHTPRNDQTHDEVTAEKRGYTGQLTERCETFIGAASRAMALTAIEMMHEFHHNQFRGGTPARHFTHHTTNVALGAADAATSQLSRPDFYTLQTPALEVLDPAAVAFTIGALHDSREDFYKNFQGTSKAINAEQGAEIVEFRIREKLTPLIGPNATGQIIQAIRTCSLDNNDEFPTSEYVDGIKGNFYARCVKQADYDHNLETFPDFSPAYALMVVPAQYQAIVADSFFERRYAEKLILNLEKFSSEELVPWNKNLKDRGIKTVEHVIDLFERYNEPKAISRLQEYYHKLHSDLGQGLYNNLLESRGLSSEAIQEKINQLLPLLQPVLPEVLRGKPLQESIPAIPDTSQLIAGRIPLRILGPMQGWGGELSFDPRFLPQVEAIINQTSAETGQRIPGYFSQPSSDTAIFHISRYPRRATQEVPALEHYRSTFETLQHNISAAGIPVASHEEIPSAPRLRVVLGLEEGYFEGRKKEVLALVEKQAVADIVELHEALTRLLGDYRGLGIEIPETSDFQSALGIIRGTTLALIHSTAEVRSFLGEHFQVSEARVFSAAPDYATPYQEPAAAIIAPVTRESFEKLLALADFFKQARFSIENLGTGLVVNTELLSFSQMTAAAMI